MINYGKFIINYKKEICNSEQTLWLRMLSFRKLSQGVHTSWLLHVLSLIRFALQVHTGAIITSLYNAYVNRLLTNHRSAHISDHRLWTPSRLSSLPLWHWIVLSVSLVHHLVSVDLRQEIDVEAQYVHSEQAHSQGYHDNRSWAARKDMSVHSCRMYPTI